MQLKQIIIENLERDLGYKFTNIDNLKLALTHRSFARLNNERLEFLGDSILSAIVSTHIYKSVPTAKEGDLTKFRAKLVCKTALASVAKSLNLSEALLLSPSEMKSGGAFNDSVLADAMEAIIGAVYIDSSFEEVSRVVIKLWDNMIDKYTNIKVSDLKDFKTILQEYLQKHKRSLPVYNLIEITGPDHELTFKVECVLEDQNIATYGTSTNKKIAEQIAAEEMIRLLQ